MLRYCHDIVSIFFLFKQLCIMNAHAIVLSSFSAVLEPRKTTHFCGLFLDNPGK